MISAETERLLIRNFRLGDWEALRQHGAILDSHPQPGVGRAWTEAHEYVDGNRNIGRVIQPQIERRRVGRTGRQLDAEKL